MHKFLLLLTFFVMTIEQNQAQQLTCRHTFAGELRDSITQKPIAQAKISLVEVQRHTISNQEGNFDMEGLCAGSYTIKIEIVGYQTFVREVSIPHKENKIRLLMQRDLVDIEEVAVTRIQREAKTLAYHVLNDQQKAEGKGKNAESTTGGFKRRDHIDHRINYPKAGY